MLNFPNAPADGEISAQPNGVKYQWNDTLSRWDSLSSKLPAVAGTVVQIQNFQTGEVVTGSNLFPYDDTIPTATDGNEWLSLPFTPKYATSILRVDVTVNQASDTSSNVRHMIMLNRDGGSAIAVQLQMEQTANSGRNQNLTLTHFTAAGNTDPSVFTVRGGSNIASEITLNGTAGARFYGGVLSSSITITEIQPNAVTPEPLQPSIAQFIPNHDGVPQEGTTPVPIDNTIPQITEGTQFLSNTITPTQVGSIIQIECKMLLSGPAANWFTNALFVNGAADAVTSTVALHGPANEVHEYLTVWNIVTTSLDPIVVTGRGGMHGIGTCNFNGGGAGLQGGALNSYLNLTEIIPTAPQSAQTNIPYVAYASINSAATITDDNGFFNATVPGTGQIDVTWKVPQPDGNYVVQVTGASGSNRNAQLSAEANITATGFQLRMYNSAGTASNGTFQVTCFRTDKPFIK